MLVDTEACRPRRATGDEDEENEQIRAHVRPIATGKKERGCQEEGSQEASSSEVKEEEDLEVAKAVCTVEVGGARWAAKYTAVERQAVRAHASMVIRHVSR